MTMEFTPPIVQETKNGREISGGELFTTATRLMSPLERRIVYAMFRNVRAQWTTHTEITKSQANEDSSLKLLGHENIKQMLRSNLVQNSDAEPVGIATLSSMMFESSHRDSGLQSTLKPFEMVHSLNTMATGDCLETFASGRTNCLEQMTSIAVLVRLYGSLLDIQDAVIVPYNTRSLGTGHATKLFHDHFGIKISLSNGSEWLMMNSGVYIPLDEMRDESGKVSSQKVKLYIRNRLSKGNGSELVSDQVAESSLHTSPSPLERNIRGLTAHMLSIYRAQENDVHEKGFDYS